MEKKFRASFIAILYACTLANNSSAKSANKNRWYLIQHKDNVTLEGAKTEGSLIEFRSSTVIAASRQDIAKFISKISNFTQWVHNAKEALVIDKRFNYTIFYTTGDAPWPVSDRHMLASLHTKSGDTWTKIHIIQANEQLMRKRYPNLNKRLYGVVMSKLRIIWLLEDVPAGCKISLHVRADPQGNIPLFLVHSAMSSFPYQTLKNLKKKILLKQP